MPLPCFTVDRFLPSVVFYILSKEIVSMPRGFETGLKILIFFGNY
jgi:hypothetical protein